MDMRNTRDVLAKHVFRVLTVGVCLLVVPMVVCLYLRARPVMAAQPLWKILFSMEWSPQAGKFGMLAFLVGTVCVSLLGMVVAVPLSLLTAIYLSEYAPRRLRGAVLPLIDVLSGIPSVIYGVWGILVIVPFVAWLGRLLDTYTSGYSLLAGALVLAVMVSPFIIHVSREVLAAVPGGIREASLSLGATRWQTVKLVVLRRALPGVVAAVVLGLARALGETIAVLMVVGNVPIVPRSLFDPAYPLPALLANNYGEMMSIPLYDSALLLAALVLLVIVVCFNLMAKGVLVFMRREG
ncbi:MAG: phosphate ABC transporter permease subunit PstC [Kiritimatiellae bacterium]|nr:phosphate ABC transporter permease subunit PstC [Kiritimatiellia bacterium]